MRIPGPNRAVPAALALAAALAVASCGSSSDETSTTTPANPPASTSTAPKGQEAPQGARAQRCGEGATSGGEIRATGVSCELGRELVAGWYKDSACFSPPGTSRTSCKLGKFTCLGATTGRGIVVTCAGPGRSVAFIGKRPG